MQDRAIVRLESVQEQAQPAKRSRSTSITTTRCCTQTRAAMGSPWRGHDAPLAAGGKNTDGRPGLPWDVALYVPLVVLMLVKHLNSREMEAYVAENVVARVFIGLQDAPSPQIRDHSNIARAYTALGKVAWRRSTG